MGTDKHQWEKQMQDFIGTGITLLVFVFCAKITWECYRAYNEAKRKGQAERQKYTLVYMSGAFFIMTLIIIVSIYEILFNGGA